MTFTTDLWCEQRDLLYCAKEKFVRDEVRQPHLRGDSHGGLQDRRPGIHALDFLLNANTNKSVQIALHFEMLGIVISDD